MQLGLILAILVTAGCLAIPAWATKPTPDEMSNARAWTSSHITKTSDTTQLPFSFTYDGKPSSEFLKTCAFEKSARRLDRNRTQHVLTYSDPRTGLVVRCVAVEYLDFPTIEWTLYFKNGGSMDTPIVENIRALDIHLQRADAEEFLLRHAVGSRTTPSDYGPLETPLAPGTTKRIGGAGGRPTQDNLSYLNLEWGNRGMIIVVGWPGQWAADFARDGGNGIHIVAGQELMHFKLLPGEEVRTPLILLQWWKGDWIRAQNIWRRWMMAHAMPRPGGKLPPPLLFGSSGRYYEEMVNANEENQLMFIRGYLENRLPINYWWMDAGWYICGGKWWDVGTWEVDPERFPKGFKPISEFAHANGIKILVWFEPEMAFAHTWLTKNHPEWILGGANGRVLNLGNPEAFNWLVNHIDKLLVDNGIDLYRQDFNIDPLPYWRANDTEDRQGITEIKHVTGYLAYWDELRRRHPNMLIDSCASGGRRNDLETMRRAVPLWRSDCAYDTIGNQCITYGISLWLPYYGTGTVAVMDQPYYGTPQGAIQPYVFWSDAAPSLNCAFDVRDKNLDYPAIRELLRQWRQVSLNYYGDFYPLTPYSQSKEVWLAWQFDRPEAGEGMIQAFRRPESMQSTATYKLRGLDPDAQYVITEVSENKPRTILGSSLIERGLLVSIPKKPGVAVITYKRKGSE